MELIGFTVKNKSKNKWNERHMFVVLHMSSSIDRDFFVYLEKTLTKRSLKAKRGEVSEGGERERWERWESRGWRKKERGKRKKEIIMRGIKKTEEREK